MTPDAPEPREPPRGLGHHVRAHARGLLAVGIASIVGILASFLFQVIAARYLAPADFGLFSAFLSIVNVAAIGSAALQNLVTVQTAAANSSREDQRVRRRWPVDAIVIGCVGGLAVALLSPALAGALDTTTVVVLAAAVSVPISFIFADALGLLQGSGDVSRAVWWTTISQVARVLGMVTAIVIGGGLAGAVGAVLAAASLALIGALWAARRVPRPAKGVFSVPGATIIVLTVAFAWLTNADVLLVRINAPVDVAGNYAAAAVLVKTGFLIPSTLALYLLPRFSRNRDNRQLVRVGVLATLALSFVTGFVMVVAFALLGSWIINLLYGASYDIAKEILAPLALAYVPWIAAQGLLIKMTSVASKGGAATLLVAAGIQWLALRAVLPDIPAVLVCIGIIGTVVLLAFLGIEWFHSRRPETRREAPATA